MTKENELPKKGRAALEIILDDVLIRLRKLESDEKDLVTNVVSRDEKLDARLDILEKEIESIKKAVKWIALIVKIIGGIVATIISLFQIFKWFVPKGKGKI
jgi:hypothetical protein